MVPGAAKAVLCRETILTPIYSLSARPYPLCRPSAPARTSFAVATAKAMKSRSGVSLQSFPSGRYSLNVQVSPSLQLAYGCRILPSGARRSKRGTPGSDLPRAPKLYVQPLRTGSSDILLGRQPSRETISDAKPHVFELVHLSFSGYVGSGVNVCLQARVNRWLLELSAEIGPPARLMRHPTGGGLSN